MNFKEAIDYGLSKPNFKVLKEGQRKAMEGYLSDQYVFVYSLSSLTGTGVRVLTSYETRIVWVKFGPFKEEQSRSFSFCYCCTSVDQVSSLRQNGIAANSVASAV